MRTAMSRTRRPSEIVLTRDTESDFLRACRIEKSENIGVGWPTGIYDRARTGHVPGATYLDESHGNSARVHAHIRARTCVYLRRVTRLRLYTCDCACVRACSRSLSDIGAIFPHVPRDKTRQGEITRGEQIHAYTSWKRRGRKRDGWNAREGKIEMENERVEYTRERERYEGREKKRPEIKIQSFRPVLHHADEDNGIPRYFLPVHGIFLSVNTRVFFLSPSYRQSTYLRMRVGSKRGT